MAIAESEIKAGTRMTEDEFIRLPKDGPGNPTAAKYELVDGRLKEVPTEFSHDAIGINLILMLGPSARGLGFMSSGQAGFRMADGNVRAPDISYTRKERIPGGRPPRSFGVVAPDLCVEIISPSEKQTDMVRKVREYFDGGAEQVWHVFPERQEVIVFTSPTETRALDTGDTLDVGDLLPGFSCRVGDIFLTE
jgi:Uma2 family endonuclease